MKIAMIGTRGVPARYGGFETAVEEVGSRLVSLGHEVVVFCRSAPDQEQPRTHRGMQLVHLPAVRRRSLETLSHTGLSAVSPALRGVDAAIVFNAANAPLLPILRMRRIPVATHVDGLEWKRTKWGPTGRRYYRAAERLAVRWSDALIADAQGIADYYSGEFAAPTRLIAYGAPILREVATDLLARHGLEPRGYHLVVARLEPENHVLEIVEGYRLSAATRPLVVVGAAPYSSGYTASVRAAAETGNVHLVGGIWDQRELDQLYAHAYTYLHGHSVGGTNPSLLRAAGAGTFTLAFDVGFNREVARRGARFFSSPSEVADAIDWAESSPAEVLIGGQELQDDVLRYDWDDVARSYELLARDLATGNVGHPRPSGRRTAAAPTAHHREPVHHDH